MDKEEKKQLNKTGRLVIRRQSYCLCKMDWVIKIYKGKYMVELSAIKKLVDLRP